jgi:3-oxoacyl-[acyl-carrier-protein] synthase II
MALRTGLVHPTANYDDPDPACELPGISAEVQERPIRTALLNAFGFGSNNAAVVFSQPPVPARGRRPRAR